MTPAQNRAKPGPNFLHALRRTAQCD
jgi:hypothetical protein